MIISERQVTQLIHIALQGIGLATSKGKEWKEWTEGVAKLVDTITNQQTDELKEII